jgi:RalA-binding protein 1
VYVDPGNNKEGWKVEKMYSDVLALDQRVRNSVGKNVGKKMASLPEGKLWKDHAPAKVDQRKVGHRVSLLYCANVRAGHP